MVGGFLVVCLLVAVFTNMLPLFSASPVLTPNKETLDECPPVITGLKATLPPCAKKVETQLATVSDDLTSPGLIEIEILSAPPGITVINAYVDEVGRAYGYVTVDCKVVESVYHIELQVTDDDGCLSKGFFLLCVGPPGRTPEPPIVNDAMPGAVLVFSLYTSDGAAPKSQNTRICLTNMNSFKRITTHLFMVEGKSCSVADTYLCLTPNQTTCFLASDLDPGVTGFAIAVAVDERTGLPVKENVLLGDAHIKMADGLETNLRAEPLQAIWHIPPMVNPKTQMAELWFDGFGYSPLPRVLSISNFPTQEDGNNTLLVLHRLSGNLAIGLDPIGSLSGELFDDAETGYSFCTGAETCQTVQRLSDNFVMRATRFKQIIPTGRSGWLKVWTTDDTGLLGAVLNFHPTPRAADDAFRQGRNLHRHSYSQGSRLFMPIFPAKC